jgi:hypothetical protein
MQNMSAYMYIVHSLFTQLGSFLVDTVRDLGKASRDTEVLV